MRLALAGVLLLFGCTVGERYQVAPAQLDALAGLSADERAHTAVAARRTRDGRAAYVCAATLVSPADGAAATGGVLARQPSRLVTAGVVLTALGAALSVAGTILYFADGSGGAAHWTGTGLAASAEPGRTDVRYLDERGSN